MSLQVLLSRWIPSFGIWLFLFINQQSQAQTSRFPLSTQGRYIVDAQQERFKVKAVNWYGPHLEAQVVAGLDHQSLEHIVGLIKAWGFNAVRLPFSNSMLHDQGPVPDYLLRANPGLQGRTALEVFDATIAALTAGGLAVLLNNHTSTSEWCCNFDGNGLWTQIATASRPGQSLEMWQNDWLNLLERYKDNKAVVAADLRNEVRTSRLGDSFIPESPNWGWGDANDWHKAAQELGIKILERYPDILIVVEGINWWGTIPLLGSGERPHLKPVRENPVRLPGGNKLVYAAHNYTHIGPQHTGEAKVSKGPRYSEMDDELFRRTLDEEWGFVVEDEQFYTAPVWVNEFGVSSEGASEADKQWFRRLVSYMIDQDLDFAYWPLNHEAYGLVTADWSRNVDDDWRSIELKRLLAANGKEGRVRANHFKQLEIAHGNDRQGSLTGDWLRGAHKGSCADGLRLMGLSRDYKALCSDVDYPDLQRLGYHVEAVHETQDRPHGTGDWAGGFSKYECPLDSYGIGFSKHHWGTSGILCARSERRLSHSCRTLWFDRGDQRASGRGGDWAPGSRKGQCGDHEYMAGIAQRNGKASALLCCSVD